MKNFLRPVFVVALAALLVANASIPSEAARWIAPLTRTYDGL